MRTPLRLFCLLAAPWLAVRANLLVADFNDVTTGLVNGKGGGTGWSGNWSGSGVATVAATDLTSSLYNVPQTGASQRLQGTNTTGLRQNYRTPAIALTGEFWFSYLASNSATTAGSGVSFNPPTATPFSDPGSAFLQFLGTSLVYRFGHASDQTLTGMTTLNTTALVVGRMVLNGGGAADTVNIWVNPDLIANPDIFGYTPAISSSALHFADSVTVIGAIAHNNTGTAGQMGRLDSLRFSDGNGNAGQAFLDVTGVVPEPAAVSLLAVGLLALRILRPKP